MLLNECYWMTFNRILFMTCPTVGRIGIEPPRPELLPAGMRLRFPLRFQPGWLQLLVLWKIAADGNELNLNTTYHFRGRNVGSMSKDGMPFY